MTAPSGGLLAWTRDPQTDRGIRFLQADGTWSFRPYAELADLVARVAAGLVAHGVPAGSTVSIVQRSGPGFVATLFGALAAGCTPSPVAPPLAFQDAQAYGAHVVGLLRTARPHLVVAEPDLVKELNPLVARVAGGNGPQPSSGCPASIDAASIDAAGIATGGILTVDDLLDAAAGDGSRPATGPALLQFTSGSSGAARGVRVSHSALLANIEAIRAWLRMAPDDATATWLPVHHDMGLIGCLLTPVVNRSDIWLMQPEQFVQRPLTYLECFGHRDARLTAMPNFGLGYIARRVRPEQVEGMDLSRWRTVIVGAERLDPAAFEAFHALLAPHGFDRLAVLPAYGLAESTLAVTGLALDEPWTGLSVDPGSLEPGRRVEAMAEDEGGQHLVGCGRPLGGARVQIRDSEGTVLPDGHVGEITVSGPSVADGYAGEPTETSRFAGGTLYSGDAGFLHDGQLYVLGRLGDSMKIRGRTLFAEDLEAAFGAAGIPPTRVAALLGARNGRPTAVAVVERAKREWLDDAARVLARRAADADLVVVDAPPGAIARTSSGKPKRRLMWRAFLADELPGQAVAGGSALHHQAKQSAPSVPTGVSR